MEINKCKEWLLNKNINPITKRKIKIDGPTYKKFKELCYNKDKNCKEWLLNKNINPITKRNIKIDGPIYKKFNELCINKKILSLILSSNSSSSSLIDSSLSYSIISSNDNKVKDKIINLIKVVRKKNLLIINKFLYENFNINNNNNCLTVKNNRIYINDIIQLKNNIGFGAYGIAYLLNYYNEIDKYTINYVIKLVVLDKYQSLYEIRILEYLTKYAIDYEFPHFPMTYDILYCKRNNITKLLENEIKDNDYNIFENLEKKKGDILFIINEYANGGDLYHYNKMINYKFSYDINKIEKYFTNAISQILISMMFYHKIVNSTHGDLHQHNVLNHKTSVGGYFHYKLYDKDYYIENIGYIWVIWDFGLSVPFDNSDKINKIREKELKTHIFNYLKNKKETNDLNNYLGLNYIKHKNFYDENNNKFKIYRNNILFDLIFFSKITDDFCIYKYYINNYIATYNFIDELINTINTDVVHKCLKLKLTSNDLPIMQKLIIEWMVKMKLLLTSIPPNSEIINKDNPYVL